MEVEGREKKRGLGFHILDIPIHILWEIMFKLPAASIVRCGGVCTKFRNIVTDSAFQQLYFSRAPISCVVLSDHRFVSCIDCSAPTGTLPSNQDSSRVAMHLQSSSSTRRSRIHKRRRQLQLELQLELELQSLSRRRFVTFQFPPNRRMNLVNSSHGLLCLRASAIPSRYYICNPLLGEILSVPPAPRASREHVRFSAFGFDPQSKQYKILQLVWKSNKMFAELYQLGDSAWRVIENASCAPVTVRPNSSFDPSLNGALHWLTHSISQLIGSFDLHANEFKSVPPPPHFDDQYVNKISGISVGVFKGRLCLCYVIGGDQFETWLMDKYGVVESWTKAFSIDINSYCGLRPQDKHRPIGFGTSGDMWFKADSDSHFHSQCLVSYTAQTGVFRHVDIGCIASKIEATPQVLSFVSLKDMVNLADTHLQF